MKTARCFINVAGLVLLAWATALLIANWTTADFAQPRDPVLQLPIRSLSWIMTGLAAVAALICLFDERISFQTYGLAWLSTNIAVYSAGFLWSGARSSSVLWGNLSTAFGVPNYTLDLIVKVMFAMLLAGSYWMLIWIWWRARHGLPTEEIFLKTACIHCGGHIAFSEARTGQSIPCPHCETNITLQTPGNLKMSCFFCKEHIEFPAHAIGEKLKCPHCKNDITLKEPA